MGLYIKIPNVAFTKYIGIAEIEDEPVVPTTYPVTDTLKGLYYLGGTQAESLVNHAEGGSNAEIPSSASVDFSNTNFARFTGAMSASRISTKVFTSQPASGLTVVAMFRVATGIRSIVSAIQSSKGFCFANTGASAYIGGSVSNNSYNNGLNSNNFSICAFSVSADGLRAVNSTGTSVSELFSDSSVVDVWSATGGITIGGGQQNLSYGDPADIALVSIHEGEVTDEQLRQIFAYVRYYGESKGLTIA